MVHLRHSILPILCTLGASLLTACLSIPKGYTPLTPLHPSPPTHKINATYSIEYAAEGSIGDLSGCAPSSQYRTYVEQFLHESGAFENTFFRNSIEPTGYHIHFKVHYFADTFSNVEFASVLTLGLIPLNTTDLSLDVSAILFHDGTPILSSATSEILDTYVSLWFLPLDLVYSPQKMWSSQESKSCRFVISQLTHALSSLHTDPTPSIQPHPNPNAP